MDVPIESRRRSFNERADEYRLARPPYPDRVYHLLVDRCGLGPGTRVLEIGPGTGLATGELLRRGARVTAVEPGAGLATHLAADLGGPTLTVVPGDFETAMLPAGFDLAVAATAFHWVRHEVAVPRLAELLRSRGWLALWWTVFGDPLRPTPFRAALPDVYGRLMPAERREPNEISAPMQVDSWTTTLTAGGWFDVVEVELIRWEHRLTTDGARRLFGSFPNTNELPPARRAEFLDAVAALVDDLGGEVADPYVTACYLARRRT